MDFQWYLNQTYYLARPLDIVNGTLVGNHSSSA